MKHTKGISPEELSRNYSGSSQFFTPPPLISCVLRGIEFLLRTEFALPDGLYNERIAFIDPAAGALEFPLTLLRSVQKRLPPIKYMRWVETVFLHNSAFFEIDPQLFSNGMTQLIQELNKVFPQNTVKPRFFCGNTLIDRNQILNSHSMPFETDPWQIRDEMPADPNEILVVLGNPPYAISSATKSAWITEKIEDYKTELNRPGEKRILGLKGIQDDYVKFLRFAQWKLCDQSHRGLVAFVINNYFLDGTIFRGLRASLIANFDAIWIINLHGDPKKRASSHSSESPKMIDENVFEIQTGICLFFGICLTNSDHHKAIIHYADVRGSKTSKFEFLDQDFSIIPFQTLSYGIDFELVPGDRALEEEYNRFPCMTDIFSENIVGIQSLHDTLITHPDKSVLEQHLNQFYSSDLEDHAIIDERGQRWIKDPELVFHDAWDWNISYGLMGSYTKALTHIYQWQWRGFDRWWVAYDEHLITKGSSQL